MTSVPFKIAVICGGPSRERGISLNSARSVLDHLERQSVEIIPIFVDFNKQFYKISTSQLYSNTPSDFDFKLKQTGTFLNQVALKNTLQGVDLIFPVIHGPFGEDGELQAYLESIQVPFIGSSSECCKVMFKKHLTAYILQDNAFPTLPQMHILKQSRASFQEQVDNFFQSNALQRAIVKPVSGGSSIDVFSVLTAAEASTKIDNMFSMGYEEVLLESFCEGKEFTIVVLEGENEEPIALVPTEVSLSYENNEIFDYRKKYLPTNQVAYHTPPRFLPEIVHHIRKKAENLFKIFKMRDFVRLDGWVTGDETVYFTDVNPISGLEQNSFFFRQTSLLGMTHRQSLEYLVKNACSRYGLRYPDLSEPASSAKFPVYVLFGGNNAERQVSLMSGTNVWLKLLKSEKYTPKAFLWDFNGNIWELPYSYALNHTVEEVLSNCKEAYECQQHWVEVRESICDKLKIPRPTVFKTVEKTLDEFLKKAVNDQAFIFIAMHGGVGEDGTLQKSLEVNTLSFNGSNSLASAICMDKYATGRIIQDLNIEGLSTLAKISFCFNDLDLDYRTFWKRSCQELNSLELIIKPQFDGCSAGIVLLNSCDDFNKYLDLLKSRAPCIPPYTFANQESLVEMPSDVNTHFLLEPFIDTDEIIVENTELKHTSKKGWIELTVGVLEKQGSYHAFNPSITVAGGAVLSLEEKFQGGTGINLTPPPNEIINDAMVSKIKRRAIAAAKGIKIENYARLDVFFNRFSGEMILIEANTLPALTPSTVLYHQGLAEEEPILPLSLLEFIIG